MHSFKIHLPFLLVISTNTVVLICIFNLTLLKVYAKSFKYYHGHHRTSSLLKELFPGSLWCELARSSIKTQKLLSVVDIVDTLFNWNVLRRHLNTETVTIRSSSKQFLFGKSVKTPLRPDTEFATKLQRIVFSLWDWLQILIMIFISEKHD